MISNIKSIQSYKANWLLLKSFYSFDKSKVLCLMLHSCDVSHPAKRWDLHHQWTSRCMEEFFVQGDREAELGLEYSPLCDRHNTMVPQSQIGKLSLCKSDRYTPSWFKKEFCKIKWAKHNANNVISKNTFWYENEITLNSKMHWRFCLIYKNWFLEKMQLRFWPKVWKVFIKLKSVKLRRKYI